jgi:hypothetical protein
MSNSDILWIGEVTVDYGCRPSFEELNGKWFDWANDGYRMLVPELRPERKDAPSTGVQTARYGYVHLNCNATDEQALAEIARQKVKPATDLEVMYYGKQFPEEQRKHPIVGLGSFFPRGGYRNSAVLHGNGHARDLGLGRGAALNPWYGDCRFLVREVLP